MYLNKSGEEFVYENIRYKIGDRVVGTDCSEYKGLFGTITEICDGNDKDTDNETPDIYCSFEVPVLPYDVENLEQRFSELYGEKKTIDDIILDEVIMAPEMIATITSLNESQRKLTIYLVMEDWAVDGEAGHTVTPCTDYDTAKRILCDKLEEEQDNGCIERWNDKDNFRMDSGSYFYECWLDAEYSENHYKVVMHQDTLLMSPYIFGQLGRSYIDESRVEDFESQIEQWDELESFSDEQYQRLIADPSIPERIHKQLGRNDLYWESYWESVSEVAHEIVKNHITENKEDSADDIL